MILLTFNVMEKPKPSTGKLESSLLKIMHDHQQVSIQIRDKTEKAKKDALRSAVRVSDLLVDTVNKGVEESYINEKQVELEIRSLASTILCYIKQTNQWLTATRALNTSLKEIGDFENWMKTMEYDCKSITAAIHNVNQRRPSS